MGTSGGNLPIFLPTMIYDMNPQGAVIWSSTILFVIDP
jgi:hypothetical protein